MMEAAATPAAAFKQLKVAHLSNKWTNKSPAPSPLISISIPSPPRPLSCYSLNNLHAIAARCRPFGNDDSPTTPSTAAPDELDSSPAAPQDLASDRQTSPPSAAPSAGDDNSKTSTLRSPQSSSQLGLVFDLGAAGSWDCGEVGSPVVKRYVSDDKERWLMWYHGSSGSAGGGDSIGLAVSNNGVHWERGQGPAETADSVGQVMRRSSDWWAFDTEELRPSEVLIMSSDKLRTSSAVYWLYYTGWTAEMEALAGQAVSQNGRHWARIEGEHHSGALLDSGAAPKVVQHGRGDLRMYYHVKINGKYTLKMARSRDGLRWVKMGEVLPAGPPGAFDENGVKNGHVVKNNNGGYVMAYTGVSAEGRSSIGLAVSADGLKKWQRCGEVVLAPSEQGWDSSGVGDPCLLLLPGEKNNQYEWRLYYRGVGLDGRTGIGLAVYDNNNGEDGDMKQPLFKRWSARIPPLLQH